MHYASGKALDVSYVLMSLCKFIWERNQREILSGMCQRERGREKIGTEDGDASIRQEEKEPMRPGAA